ncbi:MAG: hypothetical protein P8P74_12290 [Crocinitomicaceae bacterium]|nr:hypothetical protein [Crocinitomicaceae bacterium]
MEAFLYGITSILSFEVALYVIFAFILFGKLSAFFGSHIAKVIILSLTTVFLIFSFTILSPSTVYETLSSLGTIVLILTILVSLHFLGVFKAIKSVELRSLIEGTFNWLTPVVFGYWLFVQSFARIGPIIGSMMFGEDGFTQNAELVPLFFALGLSLTVGGVLVFSWFFHDKFKEMQFWKVIQVIAAIVVLLYSLRLLIMVTFV